MDEQAHFHPEIPVPPSSKPYPPKDAAPVMSSKAKLTVVEHVYHQVSNEQPTDSPTKAQLLLTSEEQPYVRKLRIGPEWTSLETGWLTEISMLLIRNDCSKRTLEVSSCCLGTPEASWVVPPGQSMRCFPAPRMLHAVQLRGETDGTKVTVTAFPK